MRCDPSGAAFRSVSMLIRGWRGSMPWGVKIVQRSRGHALAAMFLNVCVDVFEDDLNAPFNEKEDHPSRSLGVAFSGPDRRRSGDLSIFSRTLYQLSYRARSNFEKKAPRKKTLSFERACCLCDPDRT